MRVIFAGTPEFAAQALQAIIQAGHEVPLVLTQPDRPAGRGMVLQPSPVKKLALEKAIEVFQPLSLKDAAAQQRIAAIGADVMVVAAYGLILPQLVLDMPRFGCLNIHASLLPRWRGAAPIQRALLAGDAQTGVCIMQMEAGLDTGPVLLRSAFPIDSADTSATLHDRLAELGSKLIVEALGHLPLPAEPQPADGVTYAQKIEKAEALIDWRKSAAELDRHIRAFNPFPGAQALIGGQTIKLWRASMVDAQGEFGRILAVDRSAIVVACGEGALAIGELQKAGGKRLPVQQFLAGNPLKAGDRFDIPG
ncbi:methionyl-tRNA formyltransferase [Dechloromonas denitrificans]|uniref:methionyl-tRNA formyltransferase n=1 Tax=Dechloromonas denitrificans TaxID=281362 RepID=UPI001CF9075C|nr:methionyl-tRNA formyltransferase [Dechloromonas denitrificans]UCV03723.1 methionyl-tRNA formyltransferase [Dechloromonas denitrificans]UCV07984.1 methionyl-tRNA formyltransferase [Dechloromonas denitrificans]